jgi:hypothetical protein
MGELRKFQSAAILRLMRALTLTSERAIEIHSSAPQKPAVLKAAVPAPVSRDQHDEAEFGSS